MEGNLSRYLSVKYKYVTTKYSFISFKTMSSSPPAYSGRVEGIEMNNVQSMPEEKKGGENLAILHFELRKGTKSVNPENYFK